MGLGSGVALTSGDSCETRAPYGADFPTPGYKRVTSAGYSKASPFEDDLHPSNEDRWLAIDAVHQELYRIYTHVQHSPLTAVYAVFDGHGGERAAQYLKDHLLYAIVRNDYFESLDYHENESLLLAMTEGLAKLECGFSRQAMKTGDRSGACAAVVVVRGSQLCAANIGDCQAILIDHGGTIVRLSRPHRACDAEEQARIEAAHGSVQEGRLGGVLEPSRTIGDCDLKALYRGALTAEPYLCCHQLPREKGQGQALLVVASDGVWDVLSVQKVAACVTESCRDPRSAHQAAQALVGLAIEAGSLDDCTAVVARFH